QQASSQPGPQPPGIMWYPSSTYTGPDAGERTSCSSEASRARNCSISADWASYAAATSRYDVSFVPCCWAIAMEGTTRAAMAQAHMRNFILLPPGGESGYAEQGTGKKGQPGRGSRGALRG